MRIVLSAEGVCVVDKVTSAPLTFSEKSYSLGACTQVLYGPRCIQAPYLSLSQVLSAHENQERDVALGVIPARRPRVPQEDMNYYILGSVSLLSTVVSPDGVQPS